MGYGMLYVLQAAGKNTVGFFFFSDLVQMVWFLLINQLAFWKDHASNLGKF